MNKLINWAYIENNNFYYKKNRGDFKIVEKENLNNGFSDKKGGFYMAVVSGVLYEVRGEAAKKLIQELDHPTHQQIQKRVQVSNYIKQKASIIKGKKEK